MKRTLGISRIAAISLLVTVFAGWLPLAAQNDTIQESEPNNTLATASTLVGKNNLSVRGSLTAEDVDVFTFYAQPGPDGRVAIRYESAWASGDPKERSSKWLNVVLVSPNTNIIGVSSTESIISGTTSSTFGGGGAGKFTMYVYSTTPESHKIAHPFTPVPSQVTGDYRILNMRGVDGTVLGAPSKAVTKNAGWAEFGER